jgi:hypothetical protein
VLFAVIGLRKQSRFRAASRKSPCQASEPNFQVTSALRVRRTVPLIFMHLADE